jgi:hypothetical protein
MFPSASGIIVKAEIEATLKASHHLFELFNLLLGLMQWTSAKSGKETKRPLIFIGHSLGGLVTKQVNITCIIKKHPLTFRGSHLSKQRAALQEHLH